MPDLDEHGNEKVAGQEHTEGVVPVVPQTPVEPANPPKLELSQEELDDLVASAVAKAKQEDEERIREEEARSQGNFKLLYEQALQEKRQSDLALWRQQALNKYKLSEDLLDSLVGETEDELMKAAKKLRTSIDREVENKLRAETTAPPDPGRVTPPRQRVANADEVTKRNIKAGLGIGRIMH